MAAELGCIEPFDADSGSKSATVAPETTTGADRLGDGMGNFDSKGVDVTGTSEIFVSGVGRVRTGWVLLMATFCGCGGVIS